MMLIYDAVAKLREKVVDREKIVDVGMRCMVVPLLTITWIYDAVLLHGIEINGITQ